MDPRADAQAIFEAAVARVDPAPMIESAIRLARRPGGLSLLAQAGGQRLELPIPQGGRIFTVGMGKASARMALGLESVLGDALAGGIIAVKRGYGEPLERLRLVEAGHPVPDEDSVRAARLLLGLVSGGGSALLCAPAKGLSLEDKVVATRLLLGSGATIQEMNCVRKHLFSLKGGRLAAALAPARVLTLVLSDVVGDELEVIASGPTVPDPSTYSEALEVVGRRGLAARMPAAVMGLLGCGERGDLPEPPKSGSYAFSRSHNPLVGTNRLALEAAEARRRGYGTLVLSSRITGEAREVAKLFYGIARDISASGFPLRRRRDYGHASREGEAATRRWPSPTSWRPAARAAP